MSGATPAGKRVTAVALAVELRNLGRLSERVDAATRATLLERYAKFAGEQIVTRGGTLSRSKEGEVLALFRHGRAMQDAQQALRAANAITTGFEPVGAEWNTAHGVQTAVAIGLHLADTATPGGAPDAQTAVDIVAEDLDLVWRLCHRARAGELLLSEALMSVVAMTNLDVFVEPLPPFKVAHEQEISIFGVLREQRIRLD